jgi:hypothetical protein
MNFKLILALAGVAGVAALGYATLKKQWTKASDSSYIFPLGNGKFFDTRNAAIFNPTTNTWVATGTPDWQDIPLSFTPDFS